MLPAPAHDAASLDPAGSALTRPTLLPFHVANVAALVSAAAPSRGASHHALAAPEKRTADGWGVIAPG